LSLTCWDWTTGSFAQIFALPKHLIMMILRIIHSGIDFALAKRDTRCFGFPRPMITTTYVSTPRISFILPSPFTHTASKKPLVSLGAMVAQTNRRYGLFQSSISTTLSGSQCSETASANWPSMTMLDNGLPAAAVWPQISQTKKALHHPFYQR
jgi:hypothetical protein